MTCVILSISHKSNSHIAQINREAAAMSTRSKHNTGHEKELKLRHKHVGKKMRLGNAMHGKGIQQVH